MKLISWNIAGGQKYKEDQESPKYIFEEIKKLAPDLVCLQETHISNKRSFAKEVFLEAFPFISEYALSPSHNNSNYSLGLSILSKTKIDSEELVKLPNPNLTRNLNDGKIINSHDKAVQIVNIGNMCIANTQFLPLHVFLTSYNVQSEFCKNIDAILLEKLKSPLLFMGDFIYHQPQDIFPNTFLKFDLKDCLNGEPTYVYKENNPDHILYSKDLKIENSKIIKTLTDHYICYAEIKY